MSISLSYDDTLSRVRITGAVPGVRDTFTRTAADSWGATDSGHTWTNTGTAADYDVTAGVGTHNNPTVNTFHESLIALGVADVDFSATVKTDKLSVGAEQLAELVARYTDANNQYAVRVAFNTSQAVILQLRKRIGGTATVLADATPVPGLTHAANTTFALRLRVVGNLLQAKIWLASAAEPDAWTVEATDSAITAAGSIGLRSLLANTVSNAPVLFSWDDVSTRGAAVVERSTDQIRWATVRGGADLDGSQAAAVLLDDYEFAPNVANHYRVRWLNLADQASITPAMDSVWLKNIARPFLNRPIRVVDWSDVVHESRNAVFPIIGRRTPLALSDVRLAKQWELTVLTDTVDEANELVECLASGEPVLVHIPGPDCPVPGGYAVVGDVSVARSTVRAVRRMVTLPLVEVAAPGPDVVGATMTWQTVINTYATWADVIAANATWQDLLDGIADPGDVVVG